MNKLYVYALTIFSPDGHVAVLEGTHSLPTRRSKEPLTEADIWRWIRDEIVLDSVSKPVLASTYVSNELSLYVYSAEYKSQRSIQLYNRRLVWVVRDYLDPVVRADTLLQLEGGRILK